MRLFALVLLLLQACTGCASAITSPTTQAEPAFRLLWLPPPPGVPETQPATYPSPRRMVYINEVIDNSHAEVWIHQIQEAAAKYDFVTIEINTGGGSNSAGFRIMKAIEDCGKPTLCIVDGQAQSFGFDLLQSCTVRGMTKRSFIMIHESSFSVVEWSNRHVLQQYHDLAEVVDNALAEHMVRRMNISVKEMRRRIDNREWYINWHDALTYKAVDGAYSTVAIGFTKMQAKLAHPKP